MNAPHPLPQWRDQDVNLRIAYDEWVKMRKLVEEGKAAQGMLASADRILSMYQMQYIVAQRAGQS